MKYQKYKTILKKYSIIIVNNILKRSQYTYFTERNIKLDIIIKINCFIV